jgi:predicted cupin superfamily sugar epimerase/uncharacterized protein (DUF952 family)
LAAPGKPTRGDQPVADEILHLLPQAGWDRLQAGEPWAPPSLATEGFVHCSPDEATTLAVANLLYRDEPGAAGTGRAPACTPMVVLVLDEARLGDALRREPADPAPPGVDPATRFPHVYRAIELGDVDSVRYARRDPDGRYTAIEVRPHTAQALGLVPHPEGGWYRETWAAATRFTPPGFDGERAAATGILFLLEAGKESRWHTVRSDELWLWHRGGPLTLELGGDGDAPKDPERVTLGPDVEGGELVQALVPGGHWQAARPAGRDEVLVSCVVAPGFDFADFRVL